MGWEGYLVHDVQPMGIAHKEDNAFFIFDGNTGDIVLYDFKQDHGPGNADHSDGEIYTGEWKNDKISGYGTYYYTNGTKTSKYW